jgi:hypothetical protein
LSGLELLDHFASRAAAADDHADARRRQGLVGVRAAVAGQNVLDAPVSDVPRRLNSGPLAQGLARVLDGLEAHVVRFHDQETGAAAETWIDR